MQAIDTQSYHPRPRIFLVDDEEILSWCIEMELAALGFEVKTAHTIQESRELLRSFKPDLMICDEGLPDGRGTELIKQIFRQAAQFPVIMITAFTPPSEEELLAIGAHACLRKPFDLDVLNERVYRSLNLPFQANHPTPRSHFAGAWEG